MRGAARLKGWRSDYSYGTYIYAFPVQQMLAAAGVHRSGLIAYVAASAACTAPFAVASWWLVERPASRLRGAALGRPEPDVLDVRSRVKTG